MGSLVHHITALSAARYGINILEQNPPGGVRGVGTDIVAIVADLPWGPVDEITEIGSHAELIDTFCPLPFDALDDYDAMKAFINKTFPSTIKVLRIAATDQGTAEKTFQGAGAVDSVLVTAKYPGLLGNSISVTWSANATTAANRDATVTIGTTYSVTYENVAVAGTPITVNDPGDPYVTFAIVGTAGVVPTAAAATALEDGTDGTAIAGDYVGSGISGLQAFSDASEAWNVLFVAEPPSGLVTAINTGLEAFANTFDRGTLVLCTLPDQTKSAAQTYAADYRSDRLVYPWPMVNTVNVFDPTRPEVEVQGNSFAAVAIASVPPEQSPGGASGAPYLRGISSLAATGTSMTDYAALNAAGVAPFFYLRSLGGYIIHRGVTTSLTTGRTKIFRRRMTDYIVTSIAEKLEEYVEQPLDVDLANQALGPVTGPEIGQLRAFLEDLKVKGRIADYRLDEFGGNTQTNLDAGQWIIILAVKLLSMQEEIVLMASIGEAVIIDEAA